MPETGSELSFDTAKTVLVPVDAYERGVEADYLRFNGMALSAGEVAVASAPSGGIVAVMSVPAGVLDDHYKGGEVRVTSPLLYVIARPRRRRERSVDLALTAANVYIAVWDKALRLAEVLPDNSADSILYYMQVMGRRFELRKFDIKVSGEHAPKIADALRRYYGNVRVTAG